MTILLTGGGSGGHIMPLLAVARELRLLKPDCKIIAICERNSNFVHLYESEPAINQVRQISAGKYRRYSGQSVLQKVSDVGTVARNARDIGRTARGYMQAKKLLKELKPDVILIKGGFVAVPVGKAAASLGVPYLTHDSDSTPGLANRLIAKQAALHATGMPVELYNYPPDKTVFTGIPSSEKFKKITPDTRLSYREEIGLKDCSLVLSVIGGSLGAQQLNEDFVSIIGRLMSENENLGVVHITGKAHERAMKRAYDGALLANERQRVLILGFTDRLYLYSGSADIVVTRAGATSTAELATQALPIIMVPGKLAGGHQDKNAKFFEEKGAALVVPYGDATGLYEAVSKLLNSSELRSSLAAALEHFAKPEAAKELAELTLRVAEKRA